MTTKPNVTPDFIAQIRRYYAKPGNEVGGNLHAILDDPNFEDRDVLFCLTCAENRGDADGVAIGKILLMMTKTQRRKVYMAI